MRSITQPALDSKKANFISYRDQIINIFTSLKYIGIYTVFILLLASAYFWAGMLKDNKDIQAAVTNKFHASPGTGQFIQEVNSWVYHNKGFKFNSDYYLFKALGATPKQVLEGGGDCSNKSRLLSAILNIYGIKSTLLVLYGCELCGAVHTVVEAQYDKGWMISDPVFDLVFPNTKGGFYGFKDLKQDIGILPSRLNQLIQERGSANKIFYYRRYDETYEWAKYINWEKNYFTMKIASALNAIGINPTEVRRPYFLEDPKLLLSLASLALSIAFGCLFLISHLILKIMTTSTDRYLAK
jgi:hypothetical protein